ncbi:galactokinase [Ileibacterium valens]|uniref:galactokinase n=1 Tax=Ileibacterium valens TaxID=1862668 RepID=UPI002353EE73|nr:galactokinase family protein [Ileibacterium valens]
MLASAFLEDFRNGNYNQLLNDLYDDESLVAYQAKRYANAIEKFIRLFGDKEVSIFTAAGRSEVSGNHTDHQHGRVLAASINLDSIAIASKNDSGVIKVVSDDFNIAPIHVNELKVCKEEEGTSEALIRGVCKALASDGHTLGGFEAFITSDVLVGAGLSSSASFEVLIGTILSGLYNEAAIDMVEIAKASQYAENVYFGKPCGLMDQCACAVGGLITIDFQDPSKPVVKAVDADFSKYGYSLCITDTKGSHADLTHEYAAIPEEMKAVARYFGKDVLREVDPEEFNKHIPGVREAVSDRAVLRAIHFFNENERVAKIVNLLEEGDFDGFLNGIEASGNSSFKYLQNVYPSSDPTAQGVSVALALSENLLDETSGVSRVHGGGFAGTIQAFVPNDQVENYRQGMDAVFGDGSCHVLKIRAVGGKQLL